MSVSFSRLNYPGNGDSPIEFQQTALGERYKVLHKPTARVLGMVERVQLKGYKTPAWAIVLSNGVTSSTTHKTRTLATAALYRAVTGKSLSFPAPPGPLRPPLGGKA